MVHETRARENDEREKERERGGERTRTENFADSTLLNPLTRLHEPRSNAFRLSPFLRAPQRKISLRSTHLREKAAMRKKGGEG